MYSGSTWSSSGKFTITEDPVLFPEGHHESVDKITTDIACEHRAEERKINDVKTETMISSTMTVYNSNNNVVSQFSNCAGDSLELPVGTYTYEMDVEITGPLALNDTMMKETGRIQIAVMCCLPLLRKATFSREFQHYIITRSAYRISTPLPLGRLQHQCSRIKQSGS